MAHKITDKVINPVSIEKTNVHLADACFHNSTINALRYYAKNGKPHFTETADVLQLMRNWWGIMNAYLPDNNLSIVNVVLFIKIRVLHHWLTWDQWARGLKVGIP